MRRFCIILTTLFLTCTLSAQSVFEAILYGETTLNGTARYMSMGGAFGALGGEPTAILDNPAAAGIYRGSELTFTLDAMPSVSYSNWGKKMSDNDFHFNLNNVSYIFTIPSGRDKGYICSNFGLIYNRRRDYSRSVRLSGTSSNSMTDYMANLTNGLSASDLTYDNINAPYLSVLADGTGLINPLASDSTQWVSLLNAGEKVNAGYQIVESGYIDDYNFTYGANISNVFYYGISFSLQSLYYNKKTYYGERFDEGGNMVLKNNYESTGIGWNFKAGFIARPISFLRIGFSVQTPTYYSMSDNYSAFASSSLGYSDYSPSASIDYNYRSPFKLQASLGFVIGKMALIGVEYNFLDYKNTVRYVDRSYNDVFVEDPFAFENSEISNYAKQVHAVKLGGEVRFASQYAVRVGGAYFSPAMSDDVAMNILNNTTRTTTAYFVDKGSYYLGAGFGYRYNGFGIDIAYQYRRKMEGFAPYQSNAQLYSQDFNGTEYGLYGSTTGESVQVSRVHTDYHNIALTLSLKF